MDYQTNKQKNKLDKIEDEIQMKCYPKRTTNQMPYQKIENELRKNTQWPPITPNTVTVTIQNEHQNHNGYLNSTTSSQNERRSRKRSTSMTNQDEIITNL
jgi:hypothetical protein